MHSTNLSSTRIDQRPTVAVVMGKNSDSVEWLFEELRTIIRANGGIETFWPTRSHAIAELSSDCRVAGLVVDTEMAGWKVLVTGQVASSLCLPTFVICNGTNELSAVNATLRGVDHVRLVAEKSELEFTSIAEFVAANVAGRSQRCPDRPTGTGSAIPARDIFVIHAVAAEAQTNRVVNLLRALRTDPVQISAEAPLGGILDKIEAHGGVKLAVAVVTGDELCGSGGQRRKARRPRPNVLLEIGFFLGRLGRDRIVLVVEPGVDLPSDISNLHRTDFDRTDAELRIELKRALDLAQVPNQL